MDENYEWDSEFPGDMELLETLHLGLAGPRPRPEAEPELGVRALQRGCVALLFHVLPIWSPSGPSRAPCPRLAPTPVPHLHWLGLGGFVVPTTLRPLPVLVLPSPCRCEDSGGGRPSERGPCPGP